MKEKSGFTLLECCQIILNPGITMTATEVAKLASRLRGENVKLQSISSILHKLTAAGYVERTKGHGRNGGYGYTKVNNETDLHQTEA